MARKRRRVSQPRKRNTSRAGKNESDTEEEEKITWHGKVLGVQRGQKLYGEVEVEGTRYRVGEFVLLGVSGKSRKSSYHVSKIC